MSLPISIKKGTSSNGLYSSKIYSVGPIRTGKYLVLITDVNVTKSESNETHLSLIHGVTIPVTLSVYNIEFDLEDIDIEIEKFLQWAELEIAKENYIIDISWIKSYCTDEVFQRIKTHLTLAEKYYSKSELELVVNELLSRPEEDMVKYFDSLLITGGINAIIEFHVSLSNGSVLQIAEEIDHIDSIDKINFHLDYLKYKNKQNRYIFLDLDKDAYYHDSLTEKFLIKTNGFNQCYSYRDECYSSVAICESNYHSRTKPYLVYIYGCDDSSYTRHCNTLEKAIFLAEVLTYISPVIYKEHLLALGFEFTN